MKKFAILFLFALNASNAAEIRYDSGESWVAIVGVIERGDARKLADALSSRSIGGGIFRVVLASSGGDVVEAMKMGRMLRESFIATTTVRTLTGNGNCVGSVSLSADSEFFDADSCGCHSSCFVVWAGGPFRRGDTPYEEGGVDGIGIHRPKFDASYFSDLSASEAEQEYERITVLVTEYLREMGIPDELAEKMFSVSSEDIYLLSESEITALESPPAIAEWLISKCGKISEGDQSDYQSYLERVMVGSFLDDEELDPELRAEFLITKELRGLEPLSDLERRHYELLQKQQTEYIGCKRDALVAEQQLRR